MKLRICCIGRAILQLAVDVCITVLPMPSQYRLLSYSRPRTAFWLFILVRDVSQVAFAYGTSSIRFSNKFLIDLLLVFIRALTRLKASAEVCVSLLIILFSFTVVIIFLILLSCL